MSTAENVNCEDVILAYKESCIKHNSDPLETIINQLKVKMYFLKICIQYWFKLEKIWNKS